MAMISQQLDQYLQAFRNRLRRLRLLKGVAVLAAGLLFISIIGAWWSIRSGFADDVVITARIGLLAVMAFIAWRLIYLPLQSLDRGLARQIEQRVPAFGGRVETYAGMNDPANPFRELLAEDAFQLARQYPPERQVDRKELLVPGVGAGLFGLVLLALLIAGPGLFDYALRHLWAGWAFSGLLPPQTILVDPGNEAVRRGGNVRLFATMQGFEPATASVYVRSDQNEWQEVEMVQSERGFEFTFFSLREPVDYFVSAAGIRSPEYEIQVVDLPELENLKLTYHYPEWTRKAPEVFEPGGDIRAISGTGIELEISTNTPLPSGVLVLNGESQSLEISGQTGTGRFEVSADGQYYIAARVGSELVRLTDDYFIKVLEDGKPDIKFVRPGRDWNASSIEEVTVRVEVADDYAIEALQLRYAVNGGEWQSVPLNVEGRRIEIDHVFLLEQMQSAEANLQAGDLVTYYAEAKDKEKTASTDMYFIQVQPFDRRYTQSQQGGAAGGQGSEQQEISQRQKEIIVSTWNLIREKAEAGGEVRDTTKDNAILLSDLQKTLADQARTLAERTRARELNADQEIARFIAHLEKAAEAMAPASEKLAGLSLEEAIRPEQEALQHLLRAEAVFTDMQVAMQQQGGGGGGGRAGQDLAEMFELEMDLKKNQYETGSPATPQAQTQQTDETMRKLEELARRQEQLANNLRNRREATEAQRWQQEMLRREAEQLREQLERQQQQSASNQQGQQQGQQGQQGEQDEQGQQSASNEPANGQSGSSQGGNSSPSSETSRRLESAIRAMNEMTEAMRDPARRDQLERAAEEAGRQLQGAREQITQDQQQSMQQSFADMSDRADRMYEQQIGMERQLQDAVRRALANRDRDGEVTSGLTPGEEQRLAAEKREMTQQLQQLQRDIQNSAGQYREQNPEAVGQLDQARDVISQSQLEERLNVAAEYISYGAAPYIAGSESAVTNALNELSERLRQAESDAIGTDFADDDNLDRALAQTRALRQQLERLADSSAQAGEQGEQEGQPTGTDQQGRPGEFDQSQQNAQQGEPGESGQTQAGGQQTGGSRQPARESGEPDYGGPGGAYGPWGGYANRGRINPGDWDRYGRDLIDAARNIRDTLPELRDRDLSLDELNEISELTRRLEQQIALSGSDRNQQILQQQYIEALALLEQLELKLDAGTRSGEPEKVRTTANEPVADEYKEAVAEYYRRLSRDDDPATE